MAENLPNLAKKTVVQIQEAKKKKKKITGENPWGT